MLKIIRASVVTILMIVNLTTLGCVFFLIAACKAIFKIKNMQENLYGLADKIYQLWIDINSAIFKILLPTKWSYDIPKNLDNNTWYVLIANHQSWLDILVLHTIFNRKIPHMKFFMKSSLIWVPIAGQVCYVLDYPMITRKKIFSPQNRKYLASACQKLRGRPTTVINFAEGTRFTAVKHQKTKSKFTNLLTPKTGAIAAALNEMPEVQNMLDTTIYYKGNGSMWRFLSGQIPNIKLHCTLNALDESWQGEYYKDKVYRDKINKRIDKIWQEKSALLKKMEQQI